MKQRAWVGGVIALTLTATAQGQQPSKDPEALKRELAAYEQNARYTAPLFPVAGLGSTELLLELLQRRSERTQLQLAGVKLSTPAEARGGLQRTTIAVTANGASLVPLLRFLNSLEREERFLTLTALQLALGKPDPSEPEATPLDARLTFSAYTDKPSAKTRKRERGLEGQVRAWRQRERVILQLFARKVMWSQKLIQLCTVFADYPGLWLTRLEISDKRGLVLTIAGAGSSLRSVSRFRSSLRAKAVLMTGLGRLGDVEVRVRSLPPNTNYMQALEFGVHLPRASGPPAAHLAPSSSLGVARFVKATLRQDTPAAVAAWKALLAAAPREATQPSLQILAARTFLASRDDNGARETLEAVLTQQEDHPEALLLLGQILAGKADPRSQERGKSLLLAAARAGNPAVFTDLERLPKLRYDPAFVVRLLNAATEFQARPRELRDPFKTALRTVKPAKARKQD